MSNAEKQIAAHTNIIEPPYIYDEEDEDEEDYDCAEEDYKWSLIDMLYDQQKEAEIDL